MTVAELVQLLQAGGNTALLACVYFIWRAEKRLARLEAMLEVSIIRHGINPDEIIPHGNRPRHEHS